MDAEEPGLAADRFPEQLARTQHFSLGLPHAFALAPDGGRLLFLRSRSAEDRVSCLWLLENGTERLLAAPERLSPAKTHPGTAHDGTELPEAEQVRRERAHERHSGVVAFTTDEAVRIAAFALDGRLWTVTLDGVSRQVATAGPAVDPRLDSRGRLVAYVTDGALHVADLASGQDRQLAAPADEAVSWGLAEHVAAESMYRPRGYWWSPDGTRLLAARVDNSRVCRWWVGNPADPSRPPRPVAYPAAGTANAEVTLHVFGLDGSRVPLDWDRSAFEYVAAAGWDAHGPLISVQSRDQRTLRVLAADPDTGATTLLDEQRDPAWVQLVAGTPARTGSGTLIRTSDDGDTRRLLAGGRPVTPLGLQVREVVAVTGESVVFTASEEPTEQHLWSYRPGRGLVRHSAGPGWHTGLAAGGTVLLDSHTDAGRAFRLLRDEGSSGTVVSLAAEPLIVPRVTWLRLGRRELRTALLLPSWHRPGRPLPVLMAPYGGPALQLVTRARHRQLCEAQWFAEAGFAVLIADGRGTTGRGPVWEKAVYRDTLTAPLEDQAEALREAAAHFPDLDLSRVGIKGWSYGGTLALAAVLRMPDTFHAAVAGAAPTDQRLYDTHWRERFLGHPDANPDAYERSSLIGEAARLRRPLLLVHGLADDNVVAAHLLRMSSALLAAGRPHEVLPLPGTHVPTSEVVVAGLLRHQLGFLHRALSTR
jgi:dipeptidyl-peptidase-4